MEFLPSRETWAWWSCLQQCEGGGGVCEENTIKMERVRREKKWAGRCDCCERARRILRGVIKAIILKRSIKAKEVKRTTTMQRVKRDIIPGGHDLIKPCVWKRSQSARASHAALSSSNGQFPVSHCSECVVGGMDQSVSSLKKGHSSTHEGQ
jgi:hypothetical protein